MLRENHNNKKINVCQLHNRSYISTWVVVIFIFVDGTHCLMLVLYLAGAWNTHLYLVPRLRFPLPPYILVALYLIRYRGNLYLYLCYRSFLPTSKKSLSSIRKFFCVRGTRYWVTMLTKSRHLVQILKLLFNARVVCCFSLCFFNRFFNIPVSFHLISDASMNI